MKLNYNQLLIIRGGFSVSGSLLNSFIKGINIFFDLGRSLGNAIRRIGSRSICPL
jgi:hypothetical protein